MASLALDSLDLRSLRALRALLETSSVTAAARRMRVSQPTMSRMLGTLRATLGDAILEPMGRKLEPTKHARLLAARVDSAIAAFEALTEREEESARSSWRIATTDYGFMVVMAPFLASAEGARTELEIGPVSMDTVGAVTRGEVDLALAPRASVRGLDQLVVRPLLRDEHVVVMRPHHPLSRETLTLKRYLGAKHVVVKTESSARSLVEKALKGQRTRDVAYRVGTLSHAVATVRSTDAIATLPARFVRSVAPDLLVREAPFDIAPLEVAFVFAPRAANDVAHRRLREMLVRDCLSA